jgi:integrase
MSCGGGTQRPGRTFRTASTATWWRPSPARQIEERLDSTNDAGLGRRRLGHRELVEAFLADLGRRGDAGQLSPSTVGRYRSALDHDLAYAEQPAIARATPHAAGVDRQFQLGLATFPAGRSVAPNGRPGARPRPMRSQAFVEDAARALFAWAADPARGRLLPAGFRNPFLGRARGRRSPVVDPLGEPDITAALAATFLEACDTYQLALFRPRIFFGLRASEPCSLLAEHPEDGWLRIPCLPELGYETKGKRDKRLPLVGCLGPVIAAEGRRGLLRLRRGVAEGREQPPLLGATQGELIEEYRRRCAETRSLAAARRARLRDEVLRDAGGLRYDHVEGEFTQLARRLGWPTSATLKDFRHLFATGLENGGVPESYRRYLMGHALGRAAITGSTHLNRLREHSSAALAREWPTRLAAHQRRAVKLGILSAAP